MSSGFTHESPVSESVEWITPRDIFDRMWYGDSKGDLCPVWFDMDVCSPGEELTWVPADRHITEAEDGLSVPWHGFVWCNPPYGRGIDRWLDRMAEHDNGLALVPARTDTMWFQKYAASVSGMFFFKRRIRFHKGNKFTKNDGSPGVGNVLFAFGEKALSHLDHSTWPGVLVDVFEVR